VRRFTSLDVRAGGAGSPHRRRIVRAEFVLGCAAALTLGGLLLTRGVWLIGLGVFGVGVNYIVWATLVVLYLASVALMFAAFPGQFDRAFAVADALIERFGLVVIIVLGETVTGVVSGLTTDPTNARKVAVGLVCVLLGFGSWWTYFDFVGQRQPRSTRGGTLTWLLGHLPVTAAIAGMGATMPTLIINAMDSRTAAAPAWLLCASAAVLLVFTVVLMASLQAWQRSGALLHPIALANIAAASVEVCLAVIRPSPLVLCISLVLTFGGPWTFAVVRRAVVEVEVEVSE
jgi:low temperature requirement protein LtrA